MWRKTVKWLFGLVLFLVLALLLLGGLSTRPAASSEPATVTVYALSNGVHISLALPVRHEAYDWTTLFDPNHSRRPSLASAQDYVLIGWGSKVFYTQVPTWGELTLPLALKALAYDEAAFNVTYMQPPRVGEYVREIRLSERQYRQLVAAMLRDVRWAGDAAGQAKVIPGVHYGATDVFYEAKGRYTPWFTCNEWIRQRLAEAEVTVPLWSPLSMPIMWHLD